MGVPVGATVESAHGVGVTCGKGALSGALHGQAVIPAEWREKVRRPAGVCLKFAAGLDIPVLAESLVKLIV